MGVHFAGSLFESKHVLLCVLQLQETEDFVQLHLNVAVRHLAQVDGAVIIDHGEKLDQVFLPGLVVLNELTDHSADHQEFIRVNLLRKLLGQEA